jgi:hypothetical protein
VTDCAASGTVASAGAASISVKGIRLAFTSAVCPTIVRRVDAGTEGAVKFVDCVASSGFATAATSFATEAVDGAAGGGALEIVDCVALRVGGAGVSLNAGHRHRTGGRGSDVDS